MFAGASDGTAVAAGSPRHGSRRPGPGQRLAGGRGDPHRHDVARLGAAEEVDNLVVAGASAQPARVIARRALDQDVERAPDEALRALVGAALNALDQSAHALALDLAGDRPGHLG